MRNVLNVLIVLFFVFVVSNVYSSTTKDVNYFGNPETATDTSLIFNTGHGLNSPGIRLNKATSTLEARVTPSGEFKKIGSGSGSLTYNNITTDATMVANNGYVVTSTGSQLEIKLPSTLVIGDRFSIVGYGSSGWRLVTNALAATQSLAYLGRNTQLSSSSVVEIANSNEDYGQLDLIVVKTNEIVAPRFQEYSNLLLGIPYYTGVSGHWKMDEVSGDLLDSRGSSDMTRIGSPTYSADGIFDNNGAFTFPSATYFRVYNPAWAMTDGVSSNATFACWMKFGAFTVNSQYIIGNVKSTWAPDSDELALSTIGNTNEMRFGNTGSFSAVDYTPYIDGKWHYVVGVLRDADATSKKRIYIDDVSVGTVNNVGDAYNSADGYIIVGGSSTGNQSATTHIIDEPELSFNAAMTETQITEKYDSGRGARYY